MDRRTYNPVIAMHIVACWLGPVLASWSLTLHVRYRSKRWLIESKANGDSSGAPA